MTMGFDVFLDCYGETARYGLPRSSIRSLFPIIEIESEPDSWSVRYDALNSCLIYVTAHISVESQIAGLTAERPCGDERFWAAMLSILRMGSVVMFWPGSPPIIADTGNAELIPVDMVEALGQPVAIASTAEVFKLLQET